MGLCQTLFKPAVKIFILTTLTVITLFITKTASANQTILVWGDSLSAAYGIPVEKGWVNLLRKELGENIKIINGSISGETTRGGLARLPKALITHKPDYVILALGANDGLRGIPPRVTKDNLQRMIVQSKNKNAKIILLGMKIPPNYGLSYSTKFESVFAELAKHHQLAFVPFFLEEVIQKLELLQEDELHPSAEAQPMILKKILPTLTKALNS